MIFFIVTKINNLYNFSVEAISCLKPISIFLFLLSSKAQLKCLDTLSLFGVLHFLL